MAFEIENEIDIWKRCIDLQDRFKFKIIVHDQYHQLSFNQELFHSIRQPKNSFLYYIAPVSLLNWKLEKVNVLIGPANEMRSLYKKNPNHYEVVSGQSSHALLILLRNRKMQSCEKEAYETMSKAVALTRKQFLNAEIFVNKHIRNPTGWFFYLELQNGSLPANSYKKLAKLRHYIVNPKDIFWSGPQFSKGIVISISAFKNEVELHSAIEILINTIKSFI